MFLVAGGGMHDDAGGFVEDEQRFVLEQNFQRNLLRLRFGGLGVRPVNFNGVAGARGVRGLDGFAVDANVAFVNQPSNIRAPACGSTFFCAKNFPPPRAARCNG